MSKTKTIEQTFKKLNEIEHILRRPNRYLGNIKIEPRETYLINSSGQVEWRTVNYSPAFLKIFDEIITNSADFSKRPEGKHLNRIDVEINRDTGEISITDNGGIPVVKHSEYDQYVPDMIFSELRTGSNFDDEDDSVSAGQNGEGATLCNVFSTKFTVDTADGKNRFVCNYYENLSKRDQPSITKSKKSYTKISYIPDYQRLGVELDDDHHAMLVRRAYEIAATNSHLKVFVNGSQLTIKSFGDFVGLFSDQHIDFGHDRLQVSVFHSKEGFKQIGFINSTNVSDGGTHVDYIMNLIVGEIRDYIKKKTKQDIKPSDIKNHFFLMVNATFNNPRYNSQTKERLISPTKDYGTTLEIDKKVVQKLIKSPIVEQIIAWAEHKQKLEEFAALKKKNKDLDKSSLKYISKYEGATSKIRNKCMLFVAEGDSAASALQSARNPEIHGVYPFKGKPINVRGMKVSDLIENKELSELMQILGLQFGRDHSIYELRYGKLVLATDQDLDGIHLCGLTINMFEQLWPSLVKQGFLVKLQTPIVRVLKNKKEIEFMNIQDFKAWEQQQVGGYQATYLKGLASNDTKYFKKYMFDEKYLTPITYKDLEDSKALEVAFSKVMADERKQLIYGSKYE